NALRTYENVFDHAAGQNDAGIGAELAGRILDVLPGEAVASGNDVVIEEDERLGRIDGEALEIGGGAVMKDVIDADKPGVFGVGDGEALADTLVLGMGAGHVVGDGAQMAGFGQVQRAHFLGDDIGADQQTAIFHAVNVLGHLAFAAAGSALVHDDELV